MPVFHPCQRRRIVGPESPACKPRIREPDSLTRIYDSFVEKCGPKHLAAFVISIELPNFSSIPFSGLRAESLQKIIRRNLGNARVLDWKADTPRMGRCRERRSRDCTCYCQIPASVLRRAVRCHRLTDLIADHAVKRVVRRRRKSTGDAHGQQHAKQATQGRFEIGSKTRFIKEH